MKVEVSELFYSLEGEHLHTGLPTVYIRFARCNKKCPLWNNFPEWVQPDGYAKLGFTPEQYQDLASLPTITRGCDSQYAVNPRFAHMWKHYDAEELINAVLDLLPGRSWTHPKTGLPVILSLTGGEPTLKMKFIVDELIKHPLFKGCKHILFETNCSVPLREKDINQLLYWANHGDNKVTWTNSPKLPNSGELWERSIMPQVALAQRFPSADSEYFRGHCEQLFKFVIGSVDDLVTVEKAMEEYYAAGIPRSVSVALMPEACTTEQQDDIAARVADICKEQGYRFSARLQNYLWKNAVGT